MLALEFLNYFEELKNEIDIKCEHFLSLIGISQQKKEYLENQRAIFINKIDDCLKECLEHSMFEKKQQNSENKNDLSMIKKFCFLMPAKNSQELCLGKLIITNFYVPEKIKENLKFKYYNQLYNCLELNSKELVVENLIHSLIEASLTKKEYLIDLSYKDKNILENFKLEFSENSNFSPSDFDILENVISTKFLSSCELRFHNQIFISKSMLSKFDHVTSLHICLNRTNSFDANLFENFKNLQKLVITDLNDTLLRKNIFNGLEKLKCLKIHSVAIKKFEDFCFENLQNLEILKLNLESCFKIDKYNFRGLVKLNKLNLNISLANVIPNDIFEFIPNLTSLKISAKSLNQIHFLNDTDFFIKNLQFVILSSNAIFFGDSLKFKNFYSTDKKTENQIFNMYNSNKQVCIK